MRPLLAALLFACAAPASAAYFVRCAGSSGSKAFPAVSLDGVEGHCVAFRHAAAGTQQRAPEPGECSWLDRAMHHDEARVLCLHGDAGGFAPLRRDGAAVTFELTDATGERMIVLPSEAAGGKTPAAAENALEFCVFVESDLHGGAYEFFVESKRRRPEKIREVPGLDGLAGECDALVKLRQEGSRSRIGHASAQVLSAYDGEVLMRPHAERFWMPPSAWAVGEQIFSSIRPGEPAYERLLAQRARHLRKRPRAPEPAEPRQEAGEAAPAKEMAASPASAASSPVDRPSYSSAEDASKFAVIVGIEDYRGLPPARFARRDASAVRAHLQALGVPARNIAVLAGADATKAGLAKTLNAWLPNRVKKDSTVFFYYSGHGSPDPKTGRAFLVPVDGDPDYLEDTAYPLAELYARLNALGARRTLVALDSCFSGAGGRSVLAKDARPLVTRAAAEAPPSGAVVLTASDGTQISGAVEEAGHGAFTYYLLEGLNGAAAEKDGSVTVSSLYRYLKPKVEDAARLRNRDQTPQLSGPGELRLR